MDEKGTLHETFDILEPTEKVNLTPAITAKKMGFLVSMILLLIFVWNLFLVVLFSTINVIFVLTDQLGHRLKVMIEPLGILFLGVSDQLNTDFGSHVLEVVGLCSIVILIALIWAGRVTRRGVLKAVCTFISLAAIFVFAGVACEFYLVLDLGPSKLRNKMLSILGYQIAGTYLILALAGVECASDHCKKKQAEGRPVPWYSPAIIWWTTNVTAFIGILMKNFMYIQISYNCLMIMVTLIPDTFIDGFWAYRHKHDYFKFEITCAILIAIIASIVASAGPSSTDLGAIMDRDLFKYAVCNYFFVIALVTAQSIGTVVVQTTKCSAVYTSTVYKSTVLCVLITILCICKYFKVTPTNLSDFVGRSYAMIRARLGRTPPPAPPLPPAETELDTLPTDADCESKSSNQDDEQLNDITAHKKSWGLAGFTATVTAITGTTRDNESYTLLSDTESGEMSIRTSERRTECI